MWPETNEESEQLVPKLIETPHVPLVVLSQVSAVQLHIFVNPDKLKLNVVFVASEF